MFARKDSYVKLATCIAILKSLRKYSKDPKNEKKVENIVQQETTVILLEYIKLLTSILG